MIGQVGFLCSWISFRDNSQKIKYEQYEIRDECTQNVGNVIDTI